MQRAARSERLAAVAGTRALRLEEGLLRLRERFMAPRRRIDSVSC